jgi:CsoR family transcriptional regulator, copper-sensing transcriptional repressor
MPRKPLAEFPVPLSAVRQRDLLGRLRRVEGQVRGVQKMVEEGRYCVEILQQISASVQALHGVSKAVLTNYLETCATVAIRSGDEGAAKRVYSEITDLFRFAR